METVLIVWGRKKEIFKERKEEREITVNRSPGELWRLKRRGEREETLLYLKFL